MSSYETARNGQDAVRRFAKVLQREGRPASRIKASFSGEGGMAALCEVETALRDQWPATPARELIWLASSASVGGAGLRLEAFDDSGVLVCCGGYRL